MFHLECSQVCRTLSTHEQLYRAAVDIEAQKAHREHLENARLADLGFLELKQALQLKGCSKLKVDECRDKSGLIELVGTHEFDI